ncbi:MAG: hypothetical protein ICCCNLDF_01319 [Planctomycetes bacterium]|nr:hypothetical protein [Planctomycetota bacterium]
MERIKPYLNDVGLLILRLGVGGYMLSHGVGKARMVLEGNFEVFGDPIGLGSHLSLLLTAFAEFLCALLVMLGLGTRLAAVPLVVAMGVAAFVAHGADPWSMETAALRFMSGESQSWASKEPALLFLIPFLALTLTGPGRLSLDAAAAIRWKRRHRTPEAETI